jgi:gentisate 1,2-dioxygenase
MRDRHPAATPDFAAARTRRATAPPGLQSVRFERKIMNQDIRAPYYGELGRLSFSPGWARPEPAMWPAPKPRFKPAVWRFADARAALHQAGEFVPVERAERRNLIMVNPIAGNIYASSRNIVAAYQMVKAGEKARSHRHTAAALRLVVEAKPGTYTVVDGARVDMLPGDVVLTPSWCWHGHANESDATSYWIDFLDVPFVQHSEAMFFEPNPAGFEDIRDSRPSPYRIPARETLGPGNDTKLVEIAKGVLPTIGLHLLRLPAGAKREVARTTVNHLYSVIDGTARVVIEGGASETLGLGDVMVVPCWHAHEISAAESAILLQVTDEPLLAKVGLVRTA